YPELGGRDLDVVDQEGAAGAERKIVRDHAAGRQYVELARGHRLEHLGTGVEFMEVKLDALLLERAAVESGQDLAVDGDDMERAEPELCARLGQRGRADRGCREPGRATEPLSPGHPEKSCAATFSHVATSSGCGTFSGSGPAALSRSPISS